MRAPAAAKLIGWLVLATFLCVWLMPKALILPPRLTNNNWNREIVYRSRDGDIVVHCQFYSHDSTPYWEGASAWEDEHVCRRIPVDLHRGWPPRVVRVQINGRDIELRAPLLWGRLL